MPGKLQNAPIKALWEDYAARCRRLGGQLRLDLVTKVGSGAGGRSAALEREAEALLARVASPRSKVIALTEHGELMDSPELARRIGNYRDSASPDMALLVGSARGLGQLALERAHLRLALSRLTLPHELVLPVLAEQLYRALSILAGTPYHRS